MDRRSFLKFSGGTVAALAMPGAAALALADPDSPRPSAAQLRWQRDELAMFVHFGVNTFTNREWGDGTENPSIFAPANLDARQWARAARGGGFRAMILTAKHHDGFCLWPTATTEHSVAHSPFRGGNGDVVREFVDACRAEGLRPGLYLSPWDRNNPAYGDSTRYNDLYCAQLTELLTRYGPLAEFWFDGANGEGPNGKHQVYDWPRFFGLVKRHQPDAVIFSDAGPDVRWCGNEAGQAGDPNWSTVDPSAVPYPGATGPQVEPMLQHGDPSGAVWRPAEADVSIRPGWFYHPAEDDRVRSVENLLQLYFSSVGRNSKLLLNVPPTPSGLLHDVDVKRLREFHDALREVFANEVASRPVWRDAAAQETGEIDTGRETSVSAIRLEEDVARDGQRVTRHVIQVFDRGNAAWRDVITGTTIGHARLHALNPHVTARRIRVLVESNHRGSRVRVRLFTA